MPAEWYDGIVFAVKNLFFMKTDVKNLKSIPLTYKKVLLIVHTLQDII